MSWPFTLPTLLPKTNDEDVSIDCILSNMIGEG
jgi:hypothetical protein